MSPYGYQGNFWIGFDDAESLRHKVKTLIKGRGMKGAMFWSLDLDDFTGSHCGQGKYPLVNAVKEELDGPKPIVQIILKSKHIKTKTTSLKTTTTTKTIATTKDINMMKKTRCFAKGVWNGNPSMDQWCDRNCVPGGICSPQFCSCDQVVISTTITMKPTTTTTPTTTTPTTTTPTTTTPTTAKPITATTTEKSTSKTEIGKKTNKCFGINIWYGNRDMDEWCEKNCFEDSCEQSKYCSCDQHWKPNTLCRAVGLWSENEAISKWCNNTCAVGYCPEVFCSCENNY